MSEPIFDDEIRSRFSQAMSEMYRTEVPLYGELVELVNLVNKSVLEGDRQLTVSLTEPKRLDQISRERHGAIRLGKPEELRIVGRLFGIMGMQPVGYYDLSVAGIPFHATAFRPIREASMRRSPFRMFTSLLRLDLIEDPVLRSEAHALLESRQIFSQCLLQLIEQVESGFKLLDSEVDELIAESVKVFAWRSDAKVSASSYMRLHEAHPLVADVVSFKGPHINHLTPRTLDIDTVQQKMPDHGIEPKAFIEGPPQRHCPILLRQTSFKAIAETINFLSEGSLGSPGSHTARFGEIEQRGAALTPKGRALYDSCLGSALLSSKPTSDGTTLIAYPDALEQAFQEFPDDYNLMREQGLSYNYYYPIGDEPFPKGCDIDVLVDKGLVGFKPILYEDFLPISAAGIFQSNMGYKVGRTGFPEANQSDFERALGRSVLDDFAIYCDIEKRSIDNLFTDKGLKTGASNEAE